jgi:hypothetical protein
LIGLAQVTLRTEEFARLRYLKRAEVRDVLNKGAYSNKKVVVLEQQANAHAKVAIETRAFPNVLEVVAR